MLSPVQIVVLGTYITSQPDLNSQPLTEDGHREVARLLNLPSAFIVYKTLVSLRDLADTFSWDEVGNLTTANNERLQTLGIFAPNGLNPSRADVRAFFTNTFSGAVGVQTRAALDALWRRPTRRGEQIFATGAGTSVAPGALVFEGVVTPVEVEQARVG